VRANGTQASFDGTAKSLVGKAAQERRPAIVGEVRARMTLTAETVVAVQAGLAMRLDSVSTVAKITAPVLAIAGGDDPTTSPAEMEAYNGAPGGCEFHLLPDAGHFAAYEQPEKVAALLAEWLRQPEG
jgi:3-oxoadipate enol-lactonase